MWVGKGFVLRVSGSSSKAGGHGRRESCTAETFDDQIERSREGRDLAMMRRGKGAPRICQLELGTTTVRSEFVLQKSA